MPSGCGAVWDRSREQPGDPQADLEADGGCSSHETPAQPTRRITNNTRCNGPWIRSGDLSAPRVSEEPTRSRMKAPPRLPVLGAAGLSAEKPIFDVIPDSNLLTS